MALRAVVTCALLLATLAVAVAAPRHVYRPSLQRLHGGHVAPPDQKQHRDVDVLWFEQDLDYYNNSVEGTWMQRYFQNAEYYQPGGPVFVYISGAGSASGHWISSSFVSELGKQNNALLLELEHRFYGESHPTPDLSVESLQFLSVERAMDDFLRFRWHINEKVDSAARWVVFGGGYGGNLAAWLKDRFSQLDGAVVSGAPVSAQPNYLEYLKLVGEAIKAFDAECYDEMDAASQEFEELLKSEDGLSKINKWFGLCEPLDISKEYDVATLYSVIPDHFSRLAEFNNVSQGSPSDLERECALFKYSEGGSPLERISVYLGLQSAESCVDPSYEAILEQYRHVEWADQDGSRQWLYQRCTEFGHSLTTDSRRQPFGHRLNISYFEHMCPAVFGPEFTSKRIDQGVARINQRYGGKYPHANGVVYVHGGLDPWIDLGAIEQRGTDIHQVLIQNVSHCQDLKLPSESDAPQLVSARESIAQLVKKWVS